MRNSLLGDRGLGKDYVRIEGVGAVKDSVRGEMKDSGLAHLGLGPFFSGVGTDEDSAAIRSVEFRQRLNFDFSLGERSQRIITFGNGARPGCRGPGGSDSLVLSIGGGRIGLAKGQFRVSECEQYG